jgi:hypothetical protein
MIVAEEFIEAISQRDQKDNRGWVFVCGVDAGSA